MATFKVGQRVKRVAELHARIPLGSTGTVSGPASDSGGVRVTWDTVVTEYEYFCPSTLAPLTDPLADAFVERIKKLAREPQPLVQVKA